MLLHTHDPRLRLGKDYAGRWRAGTGAGRAGDGAEERPVVLFESADGAEAHTVWRLLERHGYRMMWCPGPGGAPAGGPAASPCRLDATGHCDLVDRAAVVVSALEFGEPACAAVAHRLDEQAASGTPVVLVAPPSSAAHWSEEVPRSRVVAGPLRSQVLIRSVSRAFTPHADPPPVPAFG